MLEFLAAGGGPVPLGVVERERERMLDARRRRRLGGWLEALAEGRDVAFGQVGIRPLMRASVVMSSRRELVVYRVAQEALTNVVRHAAVRRVWLVLEVRDGQVELEVRDDGNGFGGAPAGAGLVGMRERAVLIGADLEVSGADREGTTVRLRLAA